MRLRLAEALGAVVVLAVTIAACCIALAALLGCSTGGTGDAWPASTEFSTLESGADRWSVQEAGLYTHVTGTVFVLVDNRTGVAYMATARGGLCPLLSSDGSPLLVAEAGE